ncbi:hypothetical protein [Naasia lichenicola]|nr:hypothetical protein [Naasia lichenicola]
MARRKRSHYDKAPWYKASVGGAPVWLLAGVVAFVAVVVVPAAILR